MTGPDLRTARITLRLSERELAEALRLGPNGATSLREMERGKRAITGPVQTAIELMLEETEWPPALRK